MDAKVSTVSIIFKNFLWVALLSVISMISVSMLARNPDFARKGGNVFGGNYYTYNSDSVKKAIVFYLIGLITVVVFMFIRKNDLNQIRNLDNAGFIAYLAMGTVCAIINFIACKIIIGVSWFINANIYRATGDFSAMRLLCTSGYSLVILLYVVFKYVMASILCKK